MGNAIVIGAGPAGISAALYLKRGNIDTTVIYNGSGSLKKAEKIENYYGVYPFLSGEELQKNGMQAAKSIGVNFVKEEVISLSYTDKLTVTTDRAQYTADAVILTTGAVRNTPKIDGIKELEGKGVSYCAVCDAFFYRNKNTAVLGNGSYALNEVKELINIAASVTLLTNGMELKAEFPSNLKIITTPIKSLNGDERLKRAIFEDGTEIEIDGLFVAQGTAGSTDLARKLGVITENNKIRVNSEMATNIPGLFAAGDCTGGLMQVSKAVYEGCVAGTQAIKLIRKQK